jgi:hypothetical protein
MAYNAPVTPEAKLRPNATTMWVCAYFCAPKTYLWLHYSEILPKIRALNLFEAPIMSATVKWIPKANDIGDFYEKLWNYLNFRFQIPLYINIDFHF